MTDEFETPPEFFNPLLLKWGFEHDLAASDKNHLLPRYSTKEDSALEKHWPSLGSRLWCNPPYSKPEPWVKKAFEHRNECITVMLLHANTSAKWFQNYCVNHPNVHVVFLPKRMRFNLNGKRSKHSASWPSILIYFGI